MAVGSGYNLLLIIRVKGELHAGPHTGLIRAMGSADGVVTSAGCCSTRRSCVRSSVRPSAAAYQGLGALPR